MDLPNTCLVCGLAKDGFTIEKLADDQEYLCKCDRCKQYRTTRKALLYLQSPSDKKNWHLLSGLIREMYELNEGIPLLIGNTIEELLSDSRIPPSEDLQRRSMKIMSYVQKRTTYFEESVFLDFTLESSIAYAKNAAEFQSLITLLMKQGLLERDSSLKTPGGWQVMLTAKGYEIFQSSEQSKKVFIASRFQKEKSHFIEAMKKGVDDAKFQAVCLWKEDFPDKIIDEALSGIANSKYVIIDVTDGSFNVGLEAGYALALNKQLIFVRYVENGKNDEPPYYSGHYKIRGYQTKEDLTELITNAILAYESRR